MGPFGVDGGFECLKKARYAGSYTQPYNALESTVSLGDKMFSVTDLLPVTFAPLVHEDANENVLVLKATCWSPRAHMYFPPSFRNGVVFILMCLKRNTLLSVLPKELWFTMFGMLEHCWLTNDIQNSALCHRCGESVGLSWCSRCKLVRYCGKDWCVHLSVCGCSPLRLALVFVAREPTGRGIK